MTCFFFFFSSVRENNSIPSYNKGQGASKRKKMTRKEQEKKEGSNLGQTAFCLVLTCRGKNKLKKAL